MDGGEAAPLDIFIGNTHPKATEEKIKEVLLLCAENIPGKPNLIIDEVKCLNNMELEPNPRTKCWRLTVPYSCKSVVEDDNLYPKGWSHRKFYPARQKRAAPVHGNMSGHTELGPPGAGAVQWY